MPACWKPGMDMTSEGTHSVWNIKMGCQCCRVVRRPDQGLRSQAEMCPGAPNARGDE